MNRLTPPPDSVIERTPSLVDADDIETVYPGEPQYELIWDREGYDEDDRPKAFQSVAGGPWEEVR
jgi:hypothetical protein